MSVSPSLHQWIDVYYDEIRIIRLTPGVDCGVADLLLISPSILSRPAVNIVRARRHHKSGMP
ncbi:MAG: hypothetical protein JRN53_04530 [Nitrososphaerota archaeon]|nr:hypothetical protein [Nitrososphaerota archaeon]MDG7040512.1 hypothetical protein [Nitrososphaerota archaeon]MDG7042321.1 hypothetical protein [Nitrososphaerota archaeon]MDG7046837.1 hypothetical protein [Nitrososphaerota archaeon]